jgi:hypothetical protein
MLIDKNFKHIPCVFQMINSFIFKDFCIAFRNATQHESWPLNMLAQHCVDCASYDKK